MTSPNQEMALRAIQAVERGDLAEAERCFDPDVEWRNTATFPGERTLVGPRSIIAFWRELSSSFARPDGRPGTAVGQVEQVAEEGDVVVFGLRSRGVGSSSGIPIDQRWALIFQFRDGRIGQVTVRGSFSDAAGLSGDP